MDETDLPSAVLWPDERKGPWMIDLHWSKVDGRVECVGLTITSDPDQAPSAHRNPLYDPLAGQEPRPLTTEDLRLPLRSIVEEQRRRTDNWLTETFLDGSVAVEAAASVEALVGALRAPGGHSSPQFLAQVAAVYAAADERGASPTRAVAEHPAWGPIARSTAGTWVARARKAGYLTRGTERKPGGRLTVKARKELQR